LGVGPDYVIDHVQLPDGKTVEGPGPILVDFKIPGGNKDLTVFINVEVHFN